MLGYVIRRTNLRLNYRPQICSKCFVLAEGRRLYLDEIQPLSLARLFISSSNKRRKLARYRFASLGDQPVTTVVTTVCSIVPWMNHTTTVTASSSRLAKSIYIFEAFFSCLFPKLRLLFGKVNDGIFVLTKCSPALPLRSQKLSLQGRQLPLDS